MKAFLLKFFGMDDVPDALEYTAMKWLAIFSVIMGTVLIVSNLAALRIWSLGDIPVDAGIFLFPISYLVGDLLVAVYGKRMANLVSLWTAVAACAVMLIFWSITFLPVYPGTDSESFAVVQGATGRIFLASVVGFLVSQLINNFVFDAVKAHLQMSEEFLGDVNHDSEDDDSFSFRAFVSSCVGRIPDVLLFELLAFFGMLSVEEFCKQALFAYVAGCVIELAMTLTIGKWAAHKLKYRLLYYGGREFMP